MTGIRVAIVGAGFTGTVLAARLLETLPPRASVTLIEARGAFGPGLAYGTNHPAHLMNTPAGAVSARPEEPLDFVDWLRRRGGIADPSPAMFAPRGLYGRYLADLLATAERRSDAALLRVSDTVLGLRPTSRGFSLHLASGTEREADHVVLCTGYGTPRPQAAPRRLVEDPWNEGWIARVAPNDAVIFLGSGLTMVDQVLALRAGGHTGPMLALSRRGLLPLAHSDPPPPRWPPSFDPGGLALSELLRSVRRTAKAIGDWRSTIDGLRPLSQNLWLGLSAAQRTRFERHLAPYWNVHRHRMAPNVAAAIAALRDSGALEVRAGHASRVREQIGAICVAVRWRRRQVTETIAAEWLVDCTSSGKPHSDALLWSLFSAGMAERSGSGFRILTDPGGRIIARDGSKGSGIYAIGPASPWTLGEITAIPEIRDQCSLVAADIIRFDSRRLGIRQGLG